MNFLVIISDDQRLEHYEYMPLTKKWLGAGHGREFTQTRNNIAICAPTRAGILSGLYSKDHDMFDHKTAQFNHWNATYKDNTLAKWLDDVGYRTGLIGKYHLDQQALVAKPTGWDTWKKINISFSDQNTYQTWDGTSVEDINQYQTDFLLERGQTFMSGSEPWFLYLATTHPHWMHGPAPEDTQAFRWFRWPVMDEEDVSDKPSWVSAQGPLTQADRQQIQEESVGALRETAALDRMVASLCQGIDFSDTMVFYVSDNGVFFGEHNLVGPATKDVPYDECLRVPMLARGPGIIPGKEYRSTTHQDITATIVAATGATPAWTPQAGRNLIDIQNNPTAYNDRVILHEMGGELYPSAKSDAITTGLIHSAYPNRKLIRYPSVRVDPDGPYEYEMYDLDTDPGELINVGDTRMTEQNALEDILEAELAT